MMHELPQLPYHLDALEPHISRETMDYHYGRHHRTYVEKLNAMVKSTALEHASLEKIIRATRPAPGASDPLFNNAAQAWNHAFYWQCLSPRPPIPGAALSEALNSRFGSPEGFRRRFSGAALNTFGSGWTWLVGTIEGRLEIVSTSNADTPLADGRTPLLSCDVWEHAYYIDYRNARAEYLTAFWNIVNWDFVETNLRQWQTARNAA
ncbi:MAG: superoxide dismutase [Gammaproteobacteria bacterium]